MAIYNNTLMGDQVAQMVRGQQLTPIPGTPNVQAQMGGGVSTNIGSIEAIQSRMLSAQANEQAGMALQAALQSQAGRPMFSPQFFQTNEFRSGFGLDLRQGVRTPANVAKEMGISEQQLMQQLPEQFYPPVQQQRQQPVAQPQENPNADGVNNLLNILFQESPLQQPGMGAQQ